MDSNPDDISNLINDLTTNGTDSLDPNLLKKLKAYCKTLSQNKDETSYDYLVRVLFRQMEKNHAQIRYGCFLVIEYLFEKAHIFRKIISTKKLSKLFKLSFDLGNFNQRPDPSSNAPELSQNNSHQSQQRNGRRSQPEHRSQNSTRQRRHNPLLPLKWAKKLRLKVAQVFRYWNDEFGRAYPAIQCGLRFLEINGIDFEDPELEAERIEQRLRLRSLDRLEEEFQEIEENCNGLILQIDNSFELLIPRFEFIGDDDDEDGDENFNFRPMKGLSFNIFLNRQVEIIQDDSNCDIIINLKDLCKQLHSIHQNRLLPISEKISKLELSSNRLDRLRDKNEALCARVLTIVCKSNDIKFVTNSPKTELNNDDEEDDDDDDDDDDFEDVAHDEVEYITRMMELEEKKGAKRLKIEDDPKPPFKKETPEFFNETVRLNFGCVPNEDISDDNSSEIECKPSTSGAGAESVPTLAAPSTSSTSVTNAGSGVQQCRALLPSGRLCPRQDKHNCPFHGRIIERDNDGLPLDGREREAELNRRAEQKINEWRDPNYLKLLSERTGVDLTGNSAGKKRKKYPNLVDIKASKNTPRKRLLRRFGKKRLQELAGIHHDW